MAHSWGGDRQILGDDHSRTPKAALVDIVAARSKPVTSGSSKGASFQPDESGGADDEEKRRRRELRRKLKAELRQTELAQSAAAARLEEVKRKGDAATSESTGTRQQKAGKVGNGQERTPAAGLAWPGGPDAAGTGGRSRPVIEVPARTDQLLRQMSIQASDVTPGSQFREKRTPKVNSLLFHDDFLSGNEKLPGQEKLRGKGPAGKKPAGRALDPARAKVEGARARRAADIMKMCASVLKKLQKLRGGQLFSKPVQPTADFIPDYFDVIRHPMDYGTVEKKLAQGEYGSVAEFERDMLLVFDNCIQYNGGDIRSRDIVDIARAHRAQFEREFRRVADKVREDELKTADEKRQLEEGPKLAAAAARGDARDVEVLQRRLDALERQVERDKDASARAAGGAPAAPGGGPGAKGKLPKPQPRDAEKRPMTLDEKKKLSLNLGKLPGDKLGRVVEIVQEHDPALRAAESEIELDIDSLGNEALWQLERYVANCMKSKNKERRRAEQGAGLAEGTGASDTQLRPSNENDVDVGYDAADATAPADAAARDDPAESSSSGSSSSDSGSSSSGSDSQSGSSRSEAEEDKQSNVEVQSKDIGSKSSPGKG